MSHYQEVVIPPPPGEDPEITFQRRLIYRLKKEGLLAPSGLTLQTFLENNPLVKAFAAATPDRVAPIVARFMADRSPVSTGPNLTLHDLFNIHAGFLWDARVTQKELPCSSAIASSERCSSADCGEPASTTGMSRTASSTSVPTPSTSGST